MSTFPQPPLLLSLLKPVPRHVTLCVRQSDLVKVYVGPDSPPHEVRRITAVGAKAHGLLSWGRELIMLDSDTGALVSLDPHTGDVFDLYMVSWLVGWLVSWVCWARRGYYMITCKYTAVDAHI